MELVNFAVNVYLMNTLLLFLFLFFSLNSLQSQIISNVQATQTGKNIIVTYDLTGSQSSDEFDVALYCSENSGQLFNGPLVGVTGDVGQKIKSGYGKKITWNVLADKEKLSGNRIVFEVRANKTEPFSIEMVFVNGGLFTMGCTSKQTDCGDDEKPAHQVTVSDFYIGKYEVTEKQWRDVMGSDPTELYFKDCDNCPVEKVSWNDVQKFINKLNQKTGKNYRLPTEAEWEYAARGGISTSKAYATKYAGGNNLSDVGWYSDNSSSKTHPVGQKKENELGIYDMTGNVWEWCSDWYSKYGKSSQTNPKGPETGSRRVLRGGSWSDYLQVCRVSWRDRYDPDYCNLNVGFRLVLSL
jgi:formylglycine-generating enzyme required for sulfatase activity